MVDAACDLPADFIEANNIFVIPINIEFEQSRFKDQRNEEKAVRFYRKYKKHKEARVISRPSTPDQIRNFILQQVAPHYDQALMLCVSGTRSDIFKNALIARDELEEVLRGVRDKKMLRLQEIEVFDTRTLFSGQAIVAYCANNILQYKPDLTLESLVAGCKKLSAGIKTFVLLKDLYYAKNRGKLRNDRSISSVDYAIAKSLDVKPILSVKDGETSRHDNARGFDKALSKLFLIAKDDISAGLTIPTMMVSYAGSLERLFKKRAYKEFVEFAENNEIALHVSVMSVTGGIYAGPGAVSMSYCKQESEA